MQSGVHVGLSVSESDDLPRFGLTETHVRMALGEIARAVLLANGRIAYAGHLRDDGYTAFLVQEIERVGRRNRPLDAFVPFSEHRKMSLEDIHNKIEDISVLGRYVFLDEDGESIDPTLRKAEPEPLDEDTEKRSLSAARAAVTDVIDGRVVLGGKRDGYRGRMPGVVEETLLAIRAEKPVYVAGGYGGSAGDLAVALGTDPNNWLNLDPSQGQYFDELRDAVAEHGWTPTTNGLSDEENHRLAITYRASEVALLVVVGLSRLGRSHD